MTSNAEFLTSGIPQAKTYLRLAGNEGMDKKMETTITGCIGTTLRIHSFIPSYPWVRRDPLCLGGRPERSEGIVVFTSMHASSGARVGQPGYIEVLWG